MRRKPFYEIVLVRTSASGIRSSRVAAWPIAKFNDLADIQDHRELAGEIRTARRLFEKEERSGARQ